MKIRILKAPERKTFNKINTFSVFLAGPVTEWRSELINHLKALDDNEGTEVIIIDPVNEKWDDSWVTRLSDSRFFSQVCWEHKHIESSDLCIVFLPEDRTGPISLLELGMASGSKNPEQVLVYCSEKHKLVGNIEVLCYLKDIPLVHSKEELFNSVAEILTSVDSGGSRCCEEKSEEIEKENNQETIDESQTIEIFDQLQKIKSGEENIIVVENFDEIKTEGAACSMGNIVFKNRSIYSGICKDEDGNVKTDLYYKKGGQYICETFKVVKKSEIYPEECIIIKENQT